MLFLLVSVISITKPIFIYAFSLFMIISLIALISSTNQLVAHKIAPRCYFHVSFFHFAVLHPTLGRVINAVSWLITPMILHQSCGTTTTDLHWSVIFHWVRIYPNFHWKLVTCLHDGSLYCFCLLVEPYKTINQSFNGNWESTIRQFSEGRFETADLDE